MDICKFDVGLYGHFGLKVFENGKCTLRIKKKNQITNEGRTALLMLMRPGPYPGVYPGDLADSLIQLQNRIWSLSVGTNATPPAITDDAATMTAVWTSSFFHPAGGGGSECTVITTLPNSFYLDITKVLPTGEANGNTLTEAGIFTRGDNDDPLVAAGRSLYARQIHSPIAKTVNMTVQYDWQLGITIQS